MEFYHDKSRLDEMMRIINGESNISLRIVDWFVTNYAKKYYTVYELPVIRNGKTVTIRFKVYNDYKLKLKAYSKRRFDPFCRWDRITIPYNENSCMETTIGQLNFFKWALENNILSYISEHLDEIEKDMNRRNSTAKNRVVKKKVKTRKKRQELSCSATKSIRKEEVEIVVKFD